jgi:urea transport system permease protein
MLSNELDHLPLMWEPFWSPTIGVTLALLVPTAFFMIFGALMFQARVAGVFVAIMTLAELAALYYLVYDMQPFTGGFPGLPAPYPFKAFGISLDPYTPLGYWLAVGLLAIVTLGTKALLQSKFGLIVQATRDDPERVRFLGYSVSLYQIVVYTISGLIAALAGIWWVMLTQYVSPTALETRFSISMVIWAAVGGRRSLFGAMIGAFLVNGFQSYAGDEFLYTWMLILGAIFILVVRFLPKGLAGLFETVIGYFSAIVLARPKMGASAERLRAAE